MGLRLESGRFEEAVDRAIESGKVLASQRKSYRRLFEVSPVQTLALLGQALEEPELEGPIYASAEHRKAAAEHTRGGLRPDDASVRLAVRTKTVLSQRGLLDAEGEIVLHCTADQYTDAVIQADRDLGLYLYSEAPQEGP
jgi:hypothetical protein